uniref:Uncharacterized protein n=1 Tax=Rhizophagus irregularis (strain DAOM 181602 / DAOM 197198 / MUCL 43194) TaxID=747089 RepID=U9UQQ2_RHIID
MLRGSKNFFLSGIIAAARIGRIRYGESSVHMIISRYDINKIPNHLTDNGIVWPYGLSNSYFTGTVDINGFHGAAVIS